MKYPIQIFIFLLIVLNGCDDQSYIQQKDTTQSGKLSDDNVFKDYETALDKAKGVEQTIMDAAEQQKKEMLERGY